MKTTILEVGIKWPDFVHLALTQLKDVLIEGKENLRLNRIVNRLI